MEGSTMEDPMSTPRVVAKGRMTTGSGHRKWSIAARRSTVGRSFEVPSQRPPYLRQKVADIGASVGEPWPWLRTWSVNCCFWEEASS